MERMGWEEGKGLGKDLAGETEHVKITVKTTDAGVGAKLDHGAWKENFRSMDSMFGRLGADNAAAEQAEEEADQGDVFIPQSPKLGGVLMKSSRVSHNRKLQRAKLEHRSDARNRKQVLGLTASPLVTAAQPQEDSEESEGEDFFKGDQLTAVQVKKSVSLTDYFNSKARALGHEVAESSSAGTFLAFNSGFGITTGRGEAAEEEVEEDDEKHKKKKKKDKKDKKEKKYKKDKKDKKEKKDKKDKKSKKSKREVEEEEDDEEAEPPSAKRRRKTEDDEAAAPVVEAAAKKKKKKKKEEDE